MAKVGARHSEEERKALSLRTRKIIGQLKAIETMIEDDHPCSEVMVQLISVRKALKSLTEKLIQKHLHHCVEEATEDAGTKRLEDFVKVLERYVE